METLESLQRKIDGAGELKAVVRTMKAMAASNISQYEMAVTALEDYYDNLSLAMAACFKQKAVVEFQNAGISKPKKVSGKYALVFGSEQGLIGQFNDRLADFVQKKSSSDNAEAWAIGSRIKDSLQDRKISTGADFSVPNSVNGITALIARLLTEIEKVTEKQANSEFHIYYNKPGKGVNYEQVSQKLLPLDREWQQEFTERKWPTQQLPEVLGELPTGLSDFIREYLFVSVYKACAESMASENAARLAAMQRAENNIGEMLEDLKNEYHRLRQNSIDEELFDVISGFEALKK